MAAHCGQNRRSLFHAERREIIRKGRCRMTSFITLKEEIIDLSLCASCGLCAAVCPQGLLAMNGDSVSLPVFQGLESQAEDT
ncbi:4Fe-4S binding protein, partial [Paenibacillus riograndensis]|uniref:4Fe-4S binding protein n=1 Tax=Paenibacillus riograndensis TaxID=483937 RepID=UPI0031F6FEA3